MRANGQSAVLEHSLSPETASDYLLPEVVTSSSSPWEWIYLFALLFVACFGLNAQPIRSTALAVVVGPEAAVTPSRVSMTFVVPAEGAENLSSQAALITAKVRRSQDAFSFFSHGDHSI
ncbi:MAG: hypothetical protein HYZ37_00850 [Candidatus Solibacter usitatus]|nr:hypothetical protein [Candidatus Solibacter usitatus]